MIFPKREVVEMLRKRYPSGCRVQLDQMDDAQAPPIGTHGTVRGVDDAGRYGKLFIRAVLWLAGIMEAAYPWPTVLIGATRLVRAKKVARNERS